MPEGGPPLRRTALPGNGKAVARTLCHCVSCRRATGGASVGWAVFEKGGFAVLKGEVREYSSSPGIYWGSCATCGSLVAYRRDSGPGHRDITTASLDDPDAFPPTVEIWVAEKIGWEALDPRLPPQAAQLAERVKPAGPNRRM
ncbi:MAG TPA: GFA family protein [Allosphingosinicella sp.]|jgi:hypothetical protein